MVLSRFVSTRGGLWAENGGSGDWRGCGDHFEHCNIVRNLKALLDDAAYIVQIMQITASEGYMPTPATISLIFYGGDAAQNRLNLYDASASYEGLANACHNRTFLSETGDYRKSAQQRDAAIFGPTGRRLIKTDHHSWDSERPGCNRSRSSIHGIRHEINRELGSIAVES